VSAQDFGAEARERAVTLASVANAVVVCEYANRRPLLHGSDGQADPSANRRCIGAIEDALISAKYFFQSCLDVVRRIEPVSKVRHEQLEQGAHEGDVWNLSPLESAFRQSLKRFRRTIDGPALDERGQYADFS